MARHCLRMGDPARGKRCPVLLRAPLFTLSGGQRQRLAICQAIMGKKKFLIFDEPTSGLDFRHMCQVTEWLKQLAQHGYILFVVTHDYEFLNRACNCYVRIDKIN